MMTVVLLQQRVQASRVLVEIIPNTARKHTQPANLSKSSRKEKQKIRIENLRFVLVFRYIVV